MPEGLNIVVCIKQVPDVTEVQFDPITKTLIREGVPNAVNAFDRRAITQAVALRGQYGGQVTVITMGPPQAREALVECLAVGADRAVHLVDRAFAGSDTLATSQALAMAIRREKYDIVFCGKYSIDAETGQVGPEVAELLDLPQVTGVTGLEIAADLGSLVALRETDEGFETVECSLPCLLTAAERLIRPARVDPAAMEAAGSRPVEVVIAANLTPDTSVFGLGGSPTFVAEVRSTKRSRNPRIISGEDPQAAARQVADALLDLGLFGQWKEGAGAARARARAWCRTTGPEIWVVAELVGDSLRSVTLELLGAASGLADRLEGQVAALVLGHIGDQLTRELAAFGADKVYQATDGGLGQYSAEVYAALLAQAMRERQPYAVLVPSTANGRDFAPRVAARLKLGLTGDCIGLDLDDEGRLVQLKPAFGGNIVAPIMSRTRPYMATVRPGMLQKLEPDYGRVPKIERIHGPDGVVSRTRVLSSSPEAASAGIELETAEVVVCVGAGIGSADNLEVIRKLAGVMGAAIGATRRVVDNGWLPRHQQIGLTGKAIAPKVYLGIAVRGAPNHVIGIQKSSAVFAINKDPNADILREADFGVVGDYVQIVPALTEALSAARAARLSSR